MLTAHFYQLPRSAGPYGVFTTRLGPLERLLEHVDVRRVHVRAVEREAVGEALAVVRQQLVEEVEPGGRLAAHAADAALNSLTTGRVSLRTGGTGWTIATNPRRATSPTSVET